MIRDQLAIQECKVIEDHKDRMEIKVHKDQQDQEVLEDLQV